ncbi:MAG: hypothetical protein AAGC73_02795 [Verrucomicrobiota bacterium]
MSPTTTTKAAPKHLLADVDRMLRYLIFAYIALLVLEGALRKWFLPSLSGVLLLARDPIVFAAYGLALANKRFPVNVYVISGLALMFVCVLTTLLVGHGNLAVTIFGFRANFLHIPFAFLMGSVLNRDHVIEIGRWWLWGTLIMTVLIVLQFATPQSSWFNRGVGGDTDGAGFSGAMGRFRPPGTFSFIIGVVWFYVTSTAFLVSGMMQHKKYSKLLLALSAMAVFIAIPVSISRQLMLAAALTFLVGIFSSTFQKDFLMRYLRIGLIGIVGLLIADQIPIFDDAKETFLARWERSTGEDKGGVEGALISRIIIDFTAPFTETTDVPFFGQGLGAGTQVGAQLLTGERGFELGEGEWFRLIGEAGFLLGTLFILWRFWVTVRLAQFAIIAFVRGNGMGLIMLSTAAYNIMIGQLGQTTINGFTIVGIGLTIASMRIPKKVSPTMNRPLEHASDIDKKPA